MYRAAVLGLGNIGLMYDLNKKNQSVQSHTMAYHENLNVVLLAGCDTIIERGAIFHQLAPEAKFYANQKQFLEETQVDIISICTPAARHLEDLRNIIAMKNPPKLIFCEKPVVGTRQEITELRQLLNSSTVLMIPNLSRRWHTEVQKIRSSILQGIYGTLERIHIRYTRGIYNTGSHIIDMISQFAGRVNEVRTWKKTETSADYDRDFSYSFEFQTTQGVSGVADAFDDRNYYMFEFDLYFTSGKIEIRTSGDSFFYYEVKEHPLFPAYKSLHLAHDIHTCLSESTLQNAVQHIIGVLEGIEAPRCDIEDGIHPILVAEAIERSYQQGATIEQILHLKP